MNFIKILLITITLTGCAGVVYQPYGYSQIGYPQYPIYRPRYQYNIPYHGYYGVIQPHYYN